MPKQITVFSNTEQLWETSHQLPEMLDICKYVYCGTIRQGEKEIPQVNKLAYEALTWRKSPCSLTSKESLHPISTGMKAFCKLATNSMENGGRSWPTRCPPVKEDSMNLVLIKLFKAHHNQNTSVAFPFKSGRSSFSVDDNDRTKGLAH